VHAGKKVGIATHNTVNWPVTLTFELDLDSVKLNRRAKYLSQRTFSSKVIVRTHTHQTECSTWTTKVGGKNATNYM